MATVPNPRDWSLNEVPTATHFNTDIRDATNFLTGPVRVLAKNNGGNQTLSTNTWTVITWDNEDIDPEGMHSTSVNTSRLTAVTGGYYQVWASSRWEPHSAGGNIDGGRAIMIRKNASGNIANGTEVCSDRRAASEFVPGPGFMGVAMASITGFVRLNATDHVELFAWHSEDNILNDDSQFTHAPSSNNVRSCKFGALWIAP